MGRSGIIQYGNNFGLMGLKSYNGLKEDSETNQVLSVK